MQDCKPKDVVMFSGIYRAEHGSDNKPDDEVYILNEGVFPECKTCHDEVRFTLVKDAVWARKHSNFV
jgi:hypothetical protein